MAASNRGSNGSGIRLDMQGLSKLAGVSKSTVSRALAGSPLVAIRTRDRIRQLAAKHGYVLNERARSFRRGKTSTVSVILTNEDGSGLNRSNEFFLEIIGSIADALAQAGYDLLLIHKPFTSVDEFVRSRAYQQSEGLIVVGQGHHHEQLNALTEYGIPLVVWGADLPSRKYPIVGSGNYTGGFDAVAHLLAGGCTSIAFFGDRHLPETALRYQGYSDCLREHGIDIDPDLELPVPFEPLSAAGIVDNFLVRQPKVDGIFCCSDLLALTAISSLAKLGRSVPNDVAVVGYDDIAAAARAFPALTTVDQQIRAGGKALVDTLMAQLAGREVTDTIFDSSLIIRQSTVPTPD